MYIFTIFFYTIVAKYTPERIKMHHFKKISRGSMPPNPLCMAQSAMQIGSLFTN